MTTPKTVKIKRSYHSEPAAVDEGSLLCEAATQGVEESLRASFARHSGLRAGGGASPFQFKQQAVKKWYLVAACALIWLAISAMFIVLYGVDITAETIMRKIFAIRLTLVFGALLSAILLSILLPLYFHKLKLLEERDRLIAEIRDDLARVRTLRGLLPVCSYCKKVRNDKGYWEQIERYVTNNSHAEFTHGICPECVASLKNDQTEIHFLEAALPAEK